VPPAGVVEAVLVVAVVAVTAAPALTLSCIIAVAAVHDVLVAAAVVPARCAVCVTIRGGRLAAQGLASGEGGNLLDPSALAQAPEADKGRPLVHLDLGGVKRADLTRDVIDLALGRGAAGQAGEGRGAKEDAFHVGDPSDVRTPGSAVPVRWPACRGRP
jgi:hypothetical protein